MIISQTPLRISLLGGNTDFSKYFKKHGGAVLTTTIDKYIYCIVKERFDDEIRINYSVKEIVKNVKDIKHDIVREALKLVGIDHGIEITFLSDIPSEGSGLGSSSAVAIGVLNALHMYKGHAAGAKQLAEEACHIEIDILKKPIGYQDQYAIAYGGVNLIEFGKTIKVKHVVTDVYKSLMLFYTGKTRKADKILSKMKLNKKILDRNKQLVYLVMDKVSVYDVGTNNYGSILNEYWQLKKRLNKFVTTPFIDSLYKRAISLGAYGGKIVGAGGGGFLLLVVPPNKQETLRRELGLVEIPIKFSTDGSKIIFNIRQ